MNALRVVFAEDNYLVREGVRRLLDDGDDVRVVADAASAPELLQRVREHRPDAVLTDIRMPPGHGMDGIDAALQVRRELPEIGVVVLSQHADAAYARALFRGGTQGLAYLLKESVGDRDALVRALTTVASGGSVVDPRILDELLSVKQHQTHSPLQSLTARELDVLREMAAGLTNPAIGRALHISESAVSKHISSIFAKLQLPEDPTMDRRVRAVLTYFTSATLQ